jgi:glutamyl-tRNA synthetase
MPEFAHIPLIHGADGAKLSKRHGALGVEAYADMGYLPAAMRNYLLRLGWGHGDEEIISTQQAIEWFGLDHVGRSPSRFDFAKLGNLNGHYMRACDDAELLGHLLPFLTARLSREPAAAELESVRRLLPAAKERAKDLNELADAMLFLFNKPDLPVILALLQDSRGILTALLPALTACTEWSAASVEAVVRDHATAHNLKLGQVAQPLRFALTGSKVSPPIFDVAAALGRAESLARLSALA